MSRRTQQGESRIRMGGIALITLTLIGIGWPATISVAQLDLSVFQKKDTSEEQQSKDRYECHRNAVQLTGFDPSIRPAEDDPPMMPDEKAELKAQRAVERRKQQIRYNDALKRCMKNRGYAIADH